MSPFATALAALFDDTGVSTRDEWARVLSVPAASIAKWTTDEALPTGEVMRLLFDVLRMTAGVNQEPLERFERLAKSPANELSPLYHTKEALEDYIADWSLFDELLRLRGKPAAQRVLLIEHSEVPR